MKIKYGILFGAVAIVLMMASTAFAGIAPQFEEAQIVDEPTVDQVSIVENTVYVDPSICLTSYDLPGLREMLKLTDDLETRELVEKTISEIESKDSVTGNDIKSFLGPNSGITGVYSGIISANQCGGTIWVLLGLKLIVPLVFTAIVPHIVAKWNAENQLHFKVDINVGGYHFTSDHTGIALFFMGAACNWYNTFFETLIETFFYVRGWSPFIIIS